KGNRRDRTPAALKSRQKWSIGIVFVAAAGAASPTARKVQGGQILSRFGPLNGGGAIWPRGRAAGPLTPWSERFLERYIAGLRVELLDTSPICLPLGSRAGPQRGQRWA